MNLKILVITLVLLVWVLRFSINILMTEIQRLKFKIDIQELLLKELLERDNNEK